MNSENETSAEKRPDNELSSPKPEFRKWIGVNIKLVDGHYLATFNHDKPRIFHNMPRLLTAIEIESAKLGPGPTQT